MECRTVCIDDKFGFGYSFAHGVLNCIFTKDIDNAKEYSISKIESAATQIEELVKKEKPKMIIAGASAYSRTIDFEKIENYIENINLDLINIELMKCNNNYK